MRKATRSACASKLEPLRLWGPHVDDVRWLWSQRVVDLVTARIGDESGAVVADELIGGRSRHRFVLVETLARTRRSTVFAAIDQLLAREVALKVLREPAPEPSWQLVVEAQAMTRFDHPHIVRVLELGVHEGAPHVVMELCDGDLESWLEPRPWTTVLDRLLEAGRGLLAVHTAGLVHGDVKPENILLVDGVAKLGDFGLTRPPGRARRIGGTPGFIAPELADGRRGPASDVFAFACTVWTCLYGQRPFGEPPASAHSSAATLVLVERAREGSIATPPARSQVPAAVAQILRHGLAPEPRRRCTLAQLLDELAQLRSAGPLRRWLWSRQRDARSR